MASELGSGSRGLGSSPGRDTSFCRVYGQDTLLSLSPARVLVGTAELLGQPDRMLRMLGSRDFHHQTRGK